MEMLLVCVVDTMQSCLKYRTDALKPFELPEHCSRYYEKLQPPGTVVFALMQHRAFLSKFWLDRLD